MCCGTDAQPMQGQGILGTFLSWPSLKRGLPEGKQDIKIKDDDNNNNNDDN